MSARTLGALVACAAFAWSASAGAAPPCKNVKQCEAQCKRGIAPSCTRLGDLVGGEGPKVQALYQKACEGGDPGACRRAAMLEPDWRARRNPLMQACRAGDGIACLEVAKSARGRAAERFEEDARRLLTAACDAGEPSACDDAAALCKGGVGGPRDEACTEQLIARAAKLRAERCQRGYTDACLEVAQAITDDPDARRGAMQRACDAGASAACSEAAKQRVVLPLTGIWVELPAAKGQRWKVTGRIADSCPEETLTRSGGGETITLVARWAEDPTATCPSLRGGFDSPQPFPQAPKGWNSQLWVRAGSILTAYREVPDTLVLEAPLGGKAPAARASTLVPVLTAIGASVYSRSKFIAKVDPLTAPNVTITAPRAQTLKLPEAGLEVVLPESDPFWRVRRSEHGVDEINRLVPRKHSYTVMVARAPAPAKSCDELLEASRHADPEVDSWESVAVPGYHPRALRGKITGGLRMCAIAGSSRLLVLVPGPPEGPPAALLVALLAAAHKAPVPAPPRTLALPGTDVTLELPPDAFPWVLSARQSPPTITLERAVPMVRAMSVDLYSRAEPCEEALREASFSFMEEPDYDVFTDYRNLPAGYQARGVNMKSQAALCADLGQRRVMVLVRHHGALRHGQKRIDEIRPLLAAVMQSVQPGTAEPAAPAGDAARPYPRREQLKVTGLSVELPADGLGWKRMEFNREADILVPSSRPDSVPLLKLFHSPASASCSLLEQEWGRERDEQWEPHAFPGYYPRLRRSEWQLTLCLDTAGATPLLVAVMGDEAKFRRVGELAPMLAAIHAAVVPPRSEAATATTAARKPAPARRRGTPVFGVIDTLVGLQYFRAADPASVGDTEQGAALRYDIRIGGKNAVGHAWGVDFELGGGFGGGFVYGFNVSPVGLAVRPTRKTVVGATIGGGFSGIAVGRVPFGWQAPVDVYLATTEGRGRVFVRGRVNLVADARRDGGSEHAPFGDELTLAAGVLIGKTEDRLDSWANFGLRIDVEYRELMQTRFIGVSVGMGASGGR